MVLSCWLPYPDLTQAPQLMSIRDCRPAGGKATADLVAAHVAFEAACQDVTVQLVRLLAPLALSACH